MGKERITRRTGLFGRIRTPKSDSFDQGSVRGGMVQFRKNTVARTDTSAKDIFKLPAGATLLGFVVSGPTASNAGTTGVLDIGKTGTGDFYVADDDVKTNGAKARFLAAAAGGDVGATDIQVTATYAETGTASTAGGPWTVTALYIPA